MLVIAVVAVLVIGLFAWLASGSAGADVQGTSSDDVDFFADYVRAPFTQTGTKRLSRSFAGVAYRWHKPDYFWTGPDFWRTFQDDQRKWEAQERYAGRNRNAGHFFSLTPAGASAEARFYGVKEHDRILVKVRLKADSILDLTYEENLIEAARRFCLWSGHKNELLNTLEILVDEGPGGSSLTDDIGAWAASEGYDGIMFFGARAFQQDPDLVRQIQNGPADSLGFDMTAYSFNSLRKNPDFVNLVFLSGARLTAAVEAYAVPADAAEVRNELFVGLRTAVTKSVS